MRDRLRYFVSIARRDPKALTLDEIDELCGYVIALAPRDVSAAGASWAQRAVQRMRNGKYLAARSALSPEQPGKIRIKGGEMARGKALGGLRANNRPPTAEHAAVSLRIRRARAAERAAELTPIVSELRAAGITSLRGIARELMARGIPPPRGGDVWAPAQVARLLAAID